MSLTLTLVILFVIELLVVSAIASLLLAKRNHKQAALLEIYRNRAADYEKKLESELLELDNIEEKLACWKPITSAERIDLEGNKIDAFTVSRGKVKVSLAPRQIVTIRVI